MKSQTMDLKLIHYWQIPPWKMFEGINTQELIASETINSELFTAETTGHF
jgi:hypothetical protein